MRKSTQIKVSNTKCSALLSICVLWLINAVSAQQVCPDLQGGSFFGSLPSNTTIYPENLPSNAPVNAVGSGTAGNFLLPTSVITEVDPVITTIIPTLDGNTIEDVLINLIGLKLNAGSKLSIYKGPNTTGTLVDEITDLNFSSKIGEEYLIENDIATLVFYGSSADIYDNNIRFITGDILISSCITTRNVLVWKDFITPNSFILVDDLEVPSNDFSTVSGPLTLPACIAYFDENKEYIRSEVSFCIDQPKTAPTTGYGYFAGQYNFQLNTTPNYDIDRNGVFDTDDELKASRILWLIDQSKNASLLELPDFQTAIWETQSKQADHAFDAGSWELLAQQTIAVVPSPIEPTFDIELPTGGAAIAETGEDILIEIPFSWSATQTGQTNDIDLVIPSGVAVSVISGGTLNGTVLTVDPSTNRAVLKLNSNTIGNFTIQAVYNNPNYFNVRNLQIFEACDDAVQDFLHLGNYNNIRPFRAFSVEWVESLPVTLVSFKVSVENNTSHLIWKTADEVNFSHFNIEKSTDAKHWSVLSKIFSTPSNQYAFADNNLTHSKIYYRLKMVDIDDSYTYSEIRSISLKDYSPVFSLYPNPVTNTLYISDLNVKDIKNLKLYDQSGVIRLSSTGLKENKIDLHSLSNGLYFVRIELLSGIILNEKILVAH